MFYLSSRAGSGLNIRSKADPAFFYEQVTALQAALSYLLSHFQYFSFILEKLLYIFLRKRFKEVSSYTYENSFYLLICLYKKYIIAHALSILGLSSISRQTKETAGYVSVNYQRGSMDPSWYPRYMKSNSIFFYCIISACSLWLWQLSYNKIFSSFNILPRPSIPNLQLLSVRSKIPIPLPYFNSLRAFVP